MKINFFIFFLIISFTADSQTLTLGPKQELEKNHVIEDLILKDESGYYVLSFSESLTKPSIPIIEKYNPEFQSLYSVKLKDFESEQLDFEGLFTFADKLFITFSERFPEELKLKYLFQEINKSTGERIGNPRIILNENLKYKKSSRNFRYLVSQDSSKIAFIKDNIEVGTVGVPKDEKYDEFTVTVYDTSFEEIWSKEIKSPYNARKMNILDFSLDNDGGISILTYIKGENNRQKRAEKQPIGSYKILCYTQKQKDYFEYDLDLNNSFIIDIRMKRDSNDNLIFGGLYSGSSSYSSEGLFYIKMDSDTGETLKSHFNQFSKETLSLFIKKRLVEKGYGLSKSYLVKDFIIKPNGESILIAEFYGEILQETPRRKIYIHGDLLVATFDSEGKRKWVGKIKKSQRGQTPDYSSYAYALNDDNIYLVFNFDDRGNNICSMFLIDNQGKTTEKRLENIENPKMKFRIPGCKQIVENELTTYLTDKKYFRFGKIEF